MVSRKTSNGMTGVAQTYGLRQGWPFLTLEQGARRQCSADRAQPRQFALELRGQCFGFFGG